MRIDCPHCHQELEADAAWAELEMACPLCGGSFVVPPLPAAGAAPVSDPTAPPLPPPPPKAKTNLKLKAWNRRRRIRRFFFALTLLALLGGAAWGFHQWQGERPAVEAIRDLANRSIQWLSDLIRPPSSPAAPPPSTTPVPVLPPEPTPEPTPEPAPPAPDPVAWLIENPHRQPANLTLREDVVFPVIYEGRAAGSVKVDRGRQVALAGLDAGTVLVRYREGTMRLPHEATNLREVAAEEMTRPAPTPPPISAETPGATPDAIIAESRGDQLGASLHRDRTGKILGTTFRVWAPHAKTVAVIGEFNHWRPKADEMTLDGANGVWSSGLTKAKPGGEYMFLINGELERRDPRGRELSESGKSVIHDPAAFDWEDTVPPTCQPGDLVIYQLHAGTFHDPSPEDGKMATLRDATGRLDHLKKLGVNCVLLMPVNEFHGNHSWGYNPTDLYSIERAYGGPDALREFIREAHRRGIAVHIDVVHNHYGPDGLDLKQFDGHSGGDNGHGVYFYEDKERGTTPWGPRPDFGRKEVRAFIADSIRMLFDEYRVDGLRWDSVANIVRYNSGAAENPDGEKLIDEMAKMLRSEYPGKISIAEDAVGDDRFDGSWQYDFHHAGNNGESGVVPQLLRPPGETDVADVASRMQSDLGLGRVVYTENHDETGRLNQKRRLITDADQDAPLGLVARRKSALAAVLTLTAPGVPLIFMGQELLEEAEFHDSNPLDWGRGDVAARSSKLFRDLIHLRRNLDGQSGALQDTRIRILEEDTAKQLLVYRRYLPGRPDEDLVVVVNFSPNPVEDMPLVFPRDADWQLLVNTDDPQYGEGFTGMSADPRGATGKTRPVSLAPYSAQIFGVAAKRKP